MTKRKRHDVIFPRANEVRVYEQKGWDYAPANGTGIAGFESDHGKRLLAVGGVDIIQPDLSHAGGVAEVKKIAAMAESYDVALAPHYNVGKTVLDYVHNKEDFDFVDGFVSLPKRPGLGVEVNKELVIEENKPPHNWKNPVWHHADGSVAEW